MTMTRPCARADAPEAAAVLARAFHDRQPFTWLLPDGALRARALPGFFASTLRHIHPCERGAELAVRNNTIAGAAIWAPPGRWRATALSQLRAFPGMIRAVGLKELRQFGKRGQMLEQALHSLHPSEPHWYLAGLGIDPAAQGLGAGAELVRSGLERCGRDGVPAYLECLEELVPFYERLGFQKMHRIAMPEGTPDQVGMWWAGK